MLAVALRGSGWMLSLALVAMPVMAADKLSPEVRLAAAAGRPVEVLITVAGDAGWAFRGLNLFVTLMGILVIEGRCYVGRSEVNTELNARRAALGLCTKEQQRAKAIYQMRSNSMGFVLSRGMSGNVTILEGMEMTPEMREGLIDLGPYHPPGENED